MFAAPALTVIGVFFGLPVLAAFALSLTDFDIYALSDLGNLRFVGLGNYLGLLQNPLFWKALGNTLYFVVVGVPLSIAVSLGAALLLHSRLARFKPLFRTAYFAPVVTTVVAVAVIWRYLFHTGYGLVNWALSWVGIDPVDWLGDPHWAMPTIILFAVWKNFGYNMIIFLAGLQSIPEDLYEAARIDGASPARQFRHVTLPMLGPVLLLVSHPDPVGLFPAVRRTLRDDPGRAAAEHGQRAVPDVRRGLQVVEPGQRVGGGVPAVRADDGGDQRAAAGSRDARGRE